MKTVCPALALSASYENGLIVCAIFAGMCVSVWIWHTLGWWAYRDACARNRSGFWVVVMVLVMFPVGLLLWLAFRPPLIGDPP